MKYQSIIKGDKSQNENKDGGNKDSEDKTMEEVSCESTTKAREDLDLLPGRNMSSVRQDSELDEGKTAETKREAICLLVNSERVVNEEWLVKDKPVKHKTVCAECEKTFATEEEHRRHMNHEHTSKTDNVTLEEANLQIETKKEEITSNN